jgi:hypothetical protein
VRILKSDYVTCEYNYIHRFFIAVYLSYMVYINGHEILLTDVDFLQKEILANNFSGAERFIFLQKEREDSYLWMNITNHAEYGEEINATTFRLRRVLEVLVALVVSKEVYLFSDTSIGILRDFTITETEQGFVQDIDEYIWGVTEIFPKKALEFIAYTDRQKMYLNKVLFCAV